MEQLNKKEYITKKLKVAFYPTLIISLIIVLFVSLFLNDIEKYKKSNFVYELFYLEIRAKAVMFNIDKIQSIEELKTQISKDDEKVEDFRKRGIIGQSFVLYSDLKSFRENKKNIYENNSDLWIDYSTQKIENNIYTVKVSEEACKALNRNTLKKYRNCINNEFKIDLNKELNEEI